MTDRRVVRLALLAAGIGLVPATVEAHLVTTGLGPVYDGVTHVAVSPDDLVAAIAMALLAGLNGAGAGRGALFGVSAGWLLGGACGLAAGASYLPVSTTAISMIVLGVLTAANVRLSRALVSACAFAVGLAHGWLNGAGIAAAARDGLAIAGIVAAVFVVSALAAAFVVSLKAPWTRVAVRVIGSWVAAIGLLTLGWALHAAR